jgi:hypothetical protein
MCSTCHDHDHIERMARPKRKYVSRIEVMVPAAQSYAILFSPHCSVCGENYELVLDMQFVLFTEMTSLG